MSTIKKLGVPKTVGELREKLNDYSDDMSFEFSNQPRQELLYCEHDNLKAVCFNEVFYYEAKSPFQITIDQRWLANIMQAVYDMREAQKEYFKQPSNYRLTHSKIKESKVDNILSEAMKNGYIKPIEKPTTNQQELFV